MTEYKNGSFAATIDLDVSKQYQFRYVLNGNAWKNDREADNSIALMETVTTQLLPFNQKLKIVIMWENHGLIFYNTDKTYLPVEFFEKKQKLKTIY